VVFLGHGHDEFQMNPGRLEQGWQVNDGGGQGLARRNAFTIAACQRPGEARLGQWVEDILAKVMMIV